jgi:minor extracellular serine protease Vpr
MHTFLRISALVLFGASMATGGAEGSLTQNERAKLAPAFQTILARHAPDLGCVPMGSEGVPALLLTDGTPTYDAIVYTSDPEAVRASGFRVRSIFPGLVTAHLSAADMASLVRRGDVRYLEPGSVNYPAVDVSTYEIGAQLVHNGFVNGTPYKGKGAIVFIYDTGIDWKHLDFRDPVDTAKSRILAIWDQTLSAAPGEVPPAGMTYGVEYTKAMIDDELDGTPTGKVRERDIHGHGTHVAGTAAGNGSAIAKRYTGVAPEADIVVVKGGDASFGESNMIDGLTYALNVATRFGKPLVCNWSIGGQSGPRDGTRGYETAVNSFVSVPGIVHVNSAGNSGDSPIHTGGNISSADSVTITFTVPTYTPQTGTNNDQFEFEFYLRSSPSCRATLVSPTGITYVRTANLSGTGPDNTDGTMYLENGLSSYNGNRYVYVKVSDQASTNPPKTGTWSLRIAGLSAPAVYDGWLTSWTVGSSSVTLVGGNTSKTVTSPGNAAGTITVASYVTKWGWPTYFNGAYVYSTTFDGTGGISSFSSIGPSADGRQKPEIAAPGQGITAALSAAGAAFGNSDSIRILPGKKHWLIQGTSMAAPHVTGTAALMLGIQPTLTASQIKSLLVSTANSDGSTGAVPNYVWGQGKLDVVDATARLVAPASSVTRATMAYDVINPTTNTTVALANPVRYAVRFTPTISGKVTGAQINVTTPGNRPVRGAGPLRVEVWSNVGGSLGGIPGSKVGNTVLVPFSQLMASTYNSFDMQAANVSVTAGQEYHLVIAVSNPADTLVFRGDDGTTSPTNRSSGFNGSSWYNLQDASSGLTNRNLRIRVTVTSGTGINAVEGTEFLPAEYSLGQNYPNPFNPSTVIEYHLAAPGNVRLGVYDLLGREVTTLVNEKKGAGSYVAKFDARGLASGIYFYRLEANGFVQSKKMTLLR